MSRKKLSIKTAGSVAIATLSLLSFIGALSGCSSTPEKQIVYYYPVTRQLPPEPVYSRLMWSHLQQPAPLAAANEAPLLSPRISFQMGNTTFGEAVEGLAQTLGYSWDYPDSLKAKPVKMRKLGTAYEIAEELGAEAGADVVIDTESRRVRVSANDTAPLLQP